MFIETITAPRNEWARWIDRLRLLADLPEALIASIAWEADDGAVTSFNVWATPEATADFFVERDQPIIEAEGEPPNKQQRYGEPVAMYLRK